jgi:arylsulfatase A-like enzyme
MNTNPNRYLSQLDPDKLAAEGVRFTHCFVNPLCTPTRVALMAVRNLHQEMPNIMYNYGACCRGVPAGSPGPRTPRTHTGDST